MSIEVWDRTQFGGVAKTVVRSVEEGFELLETAEKYRYMERSIIFEDGDMVAFWERDVGVVDLRPLTVYDP